MIIWKAVKIMRLIDADALMKEFAEFVKESNNSDFADIPTWNDAVSLLGSAPTVKAIPIEWIKNIINANKYLWEHNKQRMFVDQGVVKIVNYSMIVQILSELIDRWYKENEENN